jgi:hypothetical protein
LPGPQEVQSAENLYSKYKVGKEPPQVPGTITITDAQAELLFGRSKSP